MNFIELFSLSPLARVWKSNKKSYQWIAKSPGPRLHTERICTAWRCASVTIKGEQHAVPLQTVNIIDILSAIWRAESFVVGANNEAFESRQLPARPDEVKWVTKTLPTGTTIKALQQQTSNKSVQHKEAVLGFWIESFFFCRKCSSTATGFTDASTINFIAFRAFISLHLIAFLIASRLLPGTFRPSAWRL